MKQFTNFAQFKKALSIGTNLKCINHYTIIGRDKETNKAIFGIKDLGIRPITILQTNAMALKTPKYDADGNIKEYSNSWLQFPKASEVKISNNDTLEVYGNCSQDNKTFELKLMLSYQILD